jgi:hypothetical protein
MSRYKRRPRKKTIVDETKEIRVNWMKCGEKTPHWCSFNDVNLDHQLFDALEGVYIIWYNGKPGKTVRVGQGIIRDRIAAHREDSQITKYSTNGLLITWAKISSDQREGVEKYLAVQLEPLVGDLFPDVDPIPVNLPW